VAKHEKSRLLYANKNLTLFKQVLDREMSTFGFAKNIRGCFSIPAKTTK
jgi:hypothetical protein